MCIIVYKPVGSVLPPKERFEACFENNSDGAGFMLPRNKRLHYEKGFATFEAFWGAFAPVAGLSPDKQRAIPIAAHFRIGTHGDKQAPSHTHPFPVSRDMNDYVKLSGDVDSAAMHNGMFSLPGVGKLKYDTHAKTPTGEPIFIHPSDTMDYVYNLLYPGSCMAKDWLASPLLKRIVEMTLGMSRLLIMSGDGKVAHFGSWVEHAEDKGVLYSNSGYEKRKIYVAESSGSKWYSSGYEDDDYGYDYGYTRKKSSNNSSKCPPKVGKRRDSLSDVRLFPPSARGSYGFTYSKFRASSTAYPIKGKGFDKLEFAKPGDMFLDRTNTSEGYIPYIAARDGVLGFMQGSGQRENQGFLYEVDPQTNIRWYVGMFERKRSAFVLGQTQPTQNLLPLLPKVETNIAV